MNKEQRMINEYMTGGSYDNETHKFGFMSRGAEEISGVPLLPRQDVQ